MAALPYIQIYVADYLADTAHLTTEEHGAYLLLIFNYWQRGQPLNARHLASIARMSNERWASVEHVLSEFFIVDGLTWRHKRIEADLERVNAQQTQRSMAGIASSAARKRPVKSTVVERSLNGRSTNTDTDTDTDTEAPTVSECVLVSARENTHEPPVGYSRFPPEDFQPDQTFHTFSRHRNQNADYETELARFKTHEFVNGKSDWQRAWVAWWLRARPKPTADPRNRVSAKTVQTMTNLQEYISG